MPGPRIIDYSSQQQLDSPRSPTASPSQIIDTSSLSYGKLKSGLDDLGAALKIKEDLLEAKGEEEARAWGASALSKARLDWTQQLHDRQAKAGPNAPGFTPSLLEDYSKYVDETVNTAPTAKAKRFLKERLEEFKVSLGTHAMTFEAQARIDYRTDRFNEGISNTQKLMNTDPNQYKEALAEQLAFIDASDLPPVKKSALRQKAMDNISTAAVWAQVQKSPVAFLESIGFAGDRMGADGKTRKTSGDLQGVTGNTAFDALPFEKRVQLFSQAITLKSQIDQDADAASLAKKRVLVDDITKQAWDYIIGARPNLVAARNYVEANKAILPASTYHSILVAIKQESRPVGGEGGGGPVRSDPAAFREIQLRIHNRDYEGAANLAFTYQANGRLSNEHLSSVVSTSNNLERQGGPKSSYERSRQFITGSLDPGPMVPDPVGRSRLANALDTFDDWVKSGKRTDDEIERRGKEIVDQYKFINFSETVLALPKPRSGDIPRVANPVIVNEAVRKAGAAAKAKLESGQYNKREYDGEIMILERWRRAAQSGQDAGVPSARKR